MSSPFMTPRDAARAYQSLYEPGGAERLRNAVDYASHLSECVDQRLTLKNLWLTERYINGDLNLHVHFRSMLSVEPTDYCAVLHRADSSTLNREEVGEVGRNLAPLRRARHLPRELHHIE